MTLLDQIPQGVLVAVDTAPWTYAFEAHPVYAPILQPLIDERFATGSNRAGASVLVLAEIMVQPLSRGRHDLAAAYRQFFRDPVRVAAWGCNESISELAAGLRARHRLKIIDALHVASAIYNSAAVFLSNDSGLRRVTEIQILILDDFLPAPTAL
jgi:predicted nucleic acid-binding protein